MLAAILDNDEAIRIVIIPEGASLSASKQNPRPDVSGPNGMQKKKLFTNQLTEPYLEFLI